MVEDYFILKKKLGNINLNLNSLKNIDFNDDCMINNIQRFKLRYNLKKIFGYNAWCKLITITPKDFENIFELNEEEQKNLHKKINSFQNSNTNFNIIYLNLENNALYQKKFYYFCEKYLNNNKNINILILDNIGNINYDNEFAKNIKKIPKIKLPSLIQILSENNLIEKEKIIQNNNLIIEKDFKKIKEFINSIFEYNKLLVYEGYNSKNQLIYYNVSKKIYKDELERIFETNNTVITTLNLMFENVQIKYYRENKHLSIVNNNKIGEDYLCDTQIQAFSEFIKDFTEIKDLTIDGFNYKLNEIDNDNIISLNVNTLNEFSLNKCNIIKDKYSYIPNDLEMFKNLENFWKF